LVVFKHFKELGLKKAILFALSMVVIAGCTSKSQIEQALKSNPEILFNAIKENPKKFLDTVNEAVRVAQEGAREDERKNEEARMEEEFKHPKQPAIDDKHAIFGNKDAPVTIVVYSDFECPYCGRGYQTVKQVEKEYGDKVRVVYKELPLDIHPMAMPAAKYFEAVLLQDVKKAEKFHDIVYENQKDLREGREKFLKDAAKKVGANMAKLEKDVNSEEVAKKIKEDMEEAQKFEFSGTPGYLVNGISIRGAYPFAEFKKIIDRLISGDKGEKGEKKGQ
jgi:protein-disulfide isomerase